MSKAHQLITLCRRLAAGILLLFTLIVAPSALALGVDEVVSQVQADLGGQVLDVQQVTVQHAPAYRIKLLQPSGRIKVLIVDASSGKYLVDGTNKK